MPKTAPYADFAQRLFIAQRRYELRKGTELDRRRFAASVAKAVNWGKSFSDSTVSQWFNGNQMPSVGQLEAMAKELGVHPAWLAFGDAGLITNPDGEQRPAYAEPTKPALRRNPKNGPK